MEITTAKTKMKYIMNALGYLDLTIAGQCIEPAGLV
jgi:energy-converting hydrogenase Eha subunit C